ncbi:MAG: hypothetical protein LH478_02060, partial [Chitinophagaceae bacterium]|nr:hypothetical protein [Chitinophagaceae bacterium]
NKPCPIKNWTLISRIVYSKSQIVAVGQATNSGAAGRWRSPDQQRVPIKSRQLYLHHLQLIYLQWFVYTAFVAPRAGGIWNAPGNNTFHSI